MWRKMDSSMLSVSMEIDLKTLERNMAVPCGVKDTSAIQPGSSIPRLVHKETCMKMFLIVLFIKVGKVRNNLKTYEENKRIKCSIFNYHTKVK